MPSETAVCPLSPDNTSKHRFSPLGMRRRALEGRHYQPAAKHTICLSSASCAHKHTHARPHWHTYWQEIRGRSPGLNGENWEAEWMNTALTFSVSVIQASNSKTFAVVHESSKTHSFRWLRCHAADTELTSERHATWKADCAWSHRQQRCVRLQRSTPEDQTLCHYQIIVYVDSGHDAPSLHERGLVVGIQTADIQSKNMVNLTKTHSRSQRQRWLTASLAASLLWSGNSCKKSFCFAFSKARTHTHVHRYVTVD